MPAYFKQLRNNNTRFNIRKMLRSFFKSLLIKRITFIFTGACTPQVKTMHIKLRAIIILLFYKLITVKMHLRIQTYKIAHHAKYGLLDWGAKNIKFFQRFPNKHFL
jgi:uncharacterized membrane protein